MPEETLGLVLALVEVDRLDPVRLAQFLQEPQRPERTRPHGMEQRQGRILGQRHGYSFGLKVLRD